MKNIVVYCGSSSGNHASFTQAAQEVGSNIAARGARLIYGGAKVGLMGSTADAALAGGGKVAGVLPTFLSGKELAHPSLTELFIVDTMHERKTKMFELGDAFIALPGGFGTMEELFEILTWGQLGLHHYPVGILNVDGFYDHLIAQLDGMAAGGVLTAPNRGMLLTDTSVDGLFEQMEQYKPVIEKRWIKDVGDT